MANNTSATAAEPKRAGKGMLIGLGIGAVLAAIGIVFWMMQLSGGMVQTGMRNLDSWGLYITCFMFFVGLSAGGLIISSIPNALGIEGFGGISKVAIWTSICCTIAAVGFVVVDVGNPLRLWELFLYSNMTSPLMWDIIIISTYLILSCFYLWATLRMEAGKMRHSAHRVLSVAALVVAVFVHSVTAWVFGLHVGREMWHTALLAPWFVSSALVCGTALVLIVVIALRKVGYLDLDQAYVVKMGKLLGAFVLVDLYFFGCDLLTSVYPGAEGAEVFNMLVSGPLASFFWFEVVGCVACALICFTPSFRKNSLFVVGAALAIAGIFCKRVQLLVGGFQIANIEQPFGMTEYAVTRWSNGIDAAYTGMVYWPTGIEWMVTIGVVGLAVALLFAGLRYLPLKPADEE